MTETSTPATDESLAIRLVRKYGSAGLTAAIFVTAASTPVAAQQSTVDICQTQFLPGLVNTLIQLSIYGGGIGMFLTYIGTNMLESLPNIGRSNEQSLKEIRSRALSAGLKVFLAGPIAVIIINAAGLPWAQCIDLTPF